ncbi:hypothetical protein XCR1_940013 [Xenorhabdus cabanillasii JM26]|uniref:Uncharacterized protein n=1 Tax=Xenorhabdus cabanillasii JM26 TaxID=1427517 RepID=W1J9W1_9GAMM|nr:hypothetical protein XCR1_940013 [Xenorhabdus cabanillasii JM26]
MLNDNNISLLAGRVRPPIFRYHARQAIKKNTYNVIINLTYPIQTTS